eukprot:4648545-Alexandrium_andersonii.AAC.1
MSASLVGSEMCIRDRSWPVLPDDSSARYDGNTQQHDQVASAAVARLGGGCSTYSSMATAPATATAARPALAAPPAVAAKPAARPPAPVPSEPAALAGVEQAATAAATVARHNSSLVD